MSSTTNSLKVQTIDFPTSHYVAIREDVPFGKIGERYQLNLPKVAAAVTKSGVAIVGMPCGLYFDWNMDNGTTDLAQAMPVAAPTQLGGEFIAIEMSGGKALLIDFYGDYGEMEKAHSAMEAYLKANNLKAKTPCIEQYITDPSQEPDSSKWLTKVFYLLE